MLLCPVRADGFSLACLACFVVGVCAQLCDDCSSLGWLKEDRNGPRESR